MESDKLRSLVKPRPTMNNGQAFDIQEPEFIRVAEFDVAVLVNQNGAKRNVLLAVDSIAGVESLAGASP